jgi:capsular exopolysaccharide synthesis family protein
MIGCSELPAAVVEQYRRVAAGLHQAQCTSGVKLLMVASALPGEGKTLLASNLALTLSGSYGRRVLLVDADLRRPSLHSVFGIQNSYGISDMVTHGNGAAIRPVHVSETLALIPAGPPQHDPMRIVTGDGMRTLLTGNAREYDWVIIDTPPVELLPDANLLASMVDTVILVVEAARTPYQAIQRSVEALGKDRIMGVVLNRAADKLADPYKDQYGAYYGAS